jgi:hypothetical protein
MIVAHDWPAGRSRPQKLSFVLTDAQAGPFPVSSEAIWCLEENGNYRVRNIPFFIDGVSFDDVIEVEPEATDGKWRIRRVVLASGNSTIWMYAKESVRGLQLVDRLVATGCGVEGGVIPDLFAINVPAGNEIAEVIAVLDDAIEEGLIDVDYPSIRHPGVSVSED